MKGEKVKEEEDREESSEATKYEQEDLSMEEDDSEQHQVDSKSKGRGDSPPVTTKPRVFKSDWLKVFPWAFVDGDRTFCRPCLQTGQKNVFTMGKPVSFRPKKDDFKKHESVASHKDAVQALASSSVSVGASSSPPADGLASSHVCLPDPASQVPKPAHPSSVPQFSKAILPSLPGSSPSSSPTPPSSKASSPSPISILIPSSKSFVNSSANLSSSLKTTGSGPTLQPTSFIIPTSSLVQRGASSSQKPGLSCIPSSSVVLLTSPATSLSQRHPQPTALIMAPSTVQGPAGGSSRVATVAPLVTSGVPRGVAPHREGGSGVNAPRTVLLLKPIVEPTRSQGMPQNQHCD